MAFTNYDKCSLLLPMDGANNGTTFTDWSPSPKTITRFGDTKTVTAQSKYYGSSGYFDGSGDYLDTGALIDLTTGDFTISAWIHKTAAAIADFVGNRLDTPGRGFAVRVDASQRVFFYFTGGSSLQGAIVLPLNTWSHVAITRLGNTARIFVNGVLDVSSTVADGTVSTANVAVGRSGPPDVGNQLSGYLQDLLIIKGAALWTSDFTPPSRLIGQLTGNVKDHAGSNAQRTIVAMPRTTPTRAFTTTSDPSTGNYTLRAPSAESSAILLANEPTLYNDLVHRVTPE